MTKTANQLDLSPLSPASRRELRDFYQFLLERRGRTQKGHPQPAAKRNFSELCGQLSWKGDAVAVQRSMRDEW